MENFPANIRVVEAPTDARASRSDASNLTVNEGKNPVAIYILCCAQYLEILKIERRVEQCKKFQPQCCMLNNVAT
jgi:hypothetical protein